MTEKQYQIYEAVINKNLFPTQVANWPQMERIAKAIKEFSDPLADAIISSAKHRAYYHWFNSDSCTSKAEAEKYSNERWHIHLFDKERAALTAAGYIDTEPHKN